ncbi:uncharacterized protein PAC_10145 [Phialocephala subalpina]|uniref:Heterokaryon incompatibility domain-containing protein n=1 Tax=Phialocephala subalpina TaxID=576137 RepID=A0A1L7X5F2_9HELO|nr:uncharacterized protein PAC_10145 [Phialocephala subalpina]
MSTDDPLATILPGRPINVDSGSEACIELMRRWIHNCRTDHSDCVWQSDNPLPTRVVDVGSESPHTDPFLLVTKGQIGEWITLSHCWGGEMPLTTTVANLEHRRKGIRIEDLPPTFRDAVTLTRKLGFQHIWIDSLCIVQDSHEDWTKESTQMHDIYARASLNIAASSSKNPCHGIFASGNLERHLASPTISLQSSSKAHNVEGTLHIRPSMFSDPFTHTEDEPLHKRAWVMQESILSSRRVDIGSSEVKWFCRSCTKREGFPGSEDGRGSGVPSHLRAGKNLLTVPLCKVPLDPTTNGIELDGSGALSWWYSSLYRRYVRRGITMHKDILPAIAGIAEKVAERTAYQYKAGLWLEDIHRGLLWQAIWSVSRSSETACPSWSWASMNLPWNGVRQLYLDTYEPGPRATILDVNVVNTAGNPFGEVISASLTMRGHYHALGHWMDERLPVYNTECLFNDMKLAHRGTNPREYVDCATAPPGRVICTLDERPTDVHEAHKRMKQRDVICMQIGKFGQYKSRGARQKLGETIYALLLESAGQESGEYIRIGIAEIPEEDGMADGWDLKTVTVV